MSTEQRPDNKNLQPKVNTPEETESLLKKRLIWQHLTQKKIRKVLRQKLKINEIDV
jgi:hypothetical protein